jgi:hypothetical protein
MSRANVTDAMTTSHDLNDQAVIYAKLDGVPYVIAKSVVKALTDADFVCGENPYINRITEQLTEDATLLPVTDAELLARVWDNPGHDKDVVFVKAESLISHLEDIFPDVAPDLLAKARRAMLGHLAALA